MDEDLRPLVDALREAGARFAYLIGSRAEGTAREGSDIDLAAYFGTTDVTPWEIPGVDYENVDLVVLDTAPLRIAGRAALKGKLLFEVDPAERVRWEATTRKIYLDEKPRMERSWKDFVAGLRERIQKAETDGRS